MPGSRQVAQCTWSPFRSILGPGEALISPSLQGSKGPPRSVGARESHAVLAQAGHPQRQGFSAGVIVTYKGHWAKLAESVGSYYWWGMLSASGVEARDAALPAITRTALQSISWPQMTMVLRWSNLLLAKLPIL